MSNLRLLHAVTLAAISFCSIVVLPSDLTVRPLEIGSPASAQTRRVRWTPNRKLGSVRSTLSGGRRGQEIVTCNNNSSKPTALTLLVPDTAEGLVTTASNPSFFWHIETPKTVSMKFVLSDPAVAQPVFVKELQSTKSGIVQVDLPTKKPLKIGTQYRWTVLVTCKVGGTSEIYARSFIQRVNNPLLQRQIRGKSNLEKAVAFAADGIWYDALDALLEAYQKDPKNAYLRSELKSLLTQVGSKPILQVADRGL
ncbi:DUF928 domain-containing protein [Phormidesmis sp. 146-33]